MTHPVFNLRQVLVNNFQPETVGGRPILELAARVWPANRYQAFKVCYQTMRRVDDLVDHRKSQGLPLNEREFQQARQAVLSWMLDQGGVDHPLMAALREVRCRFALPFWPWERWTQAMLRDLDHDGFAKFTDYLRYCEGAAVAPGAIFMHLCGVVPTGDSYQPPTFNVRRPARPLAIFCYLVHIMRDFQTDQMQNLNYFADQQLVMAGLDRRDLRRIAEGEAASHGFRSLMRCYHRFAEYYRARARRELDLVFPFLEKPYRLSLELVYGLYSQIFEKLEPANCSFRTEDTTPSALAIRQRIEEILQENA